jgi:hypothetical protein
LRVTLVDLVAGQAFEDAIADFDQPLVDSRPGQRGDLGDDLCGLASPAERAGLDDPLSGLGPDDRPQLRPHRPGLFEPQRGQRRIRPPLNAILAIELGLAVADEVDHAGRCSAASGRRHPAELARRGARSSQAELGG